ncbi:tyrosine-type recombinase/integrase [Peribacillus simplex]|uniref:tyrosine-type recombinase/integrase n=1 Tax=Peribacillus simplex TaxID=1478 RepID=UPI00366B0338
MNILIDTLNKQSEFPCYFRWPHTFRHTFAIISHLNGADVYQIMKSLGHEQLSTTEIYLEKVFENVESHCLLYNHTYQGFHDQLLQYLQFQRVLCYVS